ncbi:armadillo-type protein [Podospora conica]|nr:armadillo-type protein [Schizothecium conicum]
MAPRRSAPAEPEEQEQEEELVTLEFDEPLTWRPGKPIPIDQLLKRLDRLSKELSELDQDTVDPASLTKVAKEVASHQLLAHKDKGVRAFAACCVVDILTLCAPNAPFLPNQLKDIFNLCVTSIIPSLFDPSNPYNNQHKYVLRSFAEYKSIVLLLDVDGSDTLLLRLFSDIFEGVDGVKSSSGEHIAKEVQFTMQELLGVLIDDAQSLPAKVIDAIMAQFLRAAPGAGKDRHDHVPLDENQATLLQKEEPEAYQMAKNLCQTYPEKMSRFVSQYFSDVVLEGTSLGGKAGAHRDADDSDDEDGPGGPSESDLRELRKSHVLIRELWKAAPMILQNVVPQVDAELAADNPQLRQLATETLGDMIAGIGAAGPPPRPTLDPAAYPPLRLDGDEGITPLTNILTTPISPVSFSQTHRPTFQNFLNRKNDKVPAIRATWTTAVGYILATSAGGIGLSREDEAAMIRGLKETLSDSDEKVRLAAVRAIESFTFRDIILKLGPYGGVQHKNDSILSTLADRSRDLKPTVRSEAMSLLSKLWGVGTGELLAGNQTVAAALGGIPSRIFNAFYANDMDLNVLMDRAIFECLVPLIYPPLKKAPKNAAANGNSQATGAAVVDGDALRAERILLMVRSMATDGEDGEGAKRAFFTMQARQPQYANGVLALIKACDSYNGGVMDEEAEQKTKLLHSTAHYLAQFLPDREKAKADFIRFAKMNDRRNYNLVKYIISQEHDFKTAHNALKEFQKRMAGGKESSLLETFLPLLYRSGCFMFNRSHLATIMEFSRSDKHGLGTVAHEVLNELSQRNPDLFKTHIGQLCKDLVDQAPTASKENDPIVAETLKACSTYARKYPKDVPMDRAFVQTMINYSLYGRPARVAKYAVNILLSKKDNKSMVSATDLLKRTVKDWTYDSPHLLNKLTTVSQLELLAPKVTEEYEEQVLNMAVQQTLLEVRADYSEQDPDWVDDAALDQEIQAKCLSLRILINRLRSIEDTEEAKTKAKPVWKMLMKLIKDEGELCKTKDTPKHHRSRLRLLAAQLLLKMCTQKHFDEILTPEGFNTLALVSQDVVQEVRHAFIRKLQKYLAEGKLRSRYYTIVFLLAFEPSSDFKKRMETWIRSRARHFEQNKQPVLEAVMPRLLSLLAHHPDYRPELDMLVDHARYLHFYLSLVATEANLGLITKYAERVKQTQDALDPTSDRHRVLCDLAQAVIRKWQERNNWIFSAYPGKVGIPMGLYIALQSHNEAQTAAEKQYTPEGLDEKLDELFKAMDRKKKRKTSDDRDGNPPSKKAKLPSRPKEPKEPKSTSKKTSATPRKKPASSKSKKPRKELTAEERADRRRSGRARGDKSYMERDSSEDDEEMLNGVAEWKYGDDSEGSEDGSDDVDSDAAPASEKEDEDTGKEDEAEEEVPKSSSPPAAKKTKATAPAKKKTEEVPASDSELSSELSEVEVEEVAEVEVEEGEGEGSDDEEVPSPPTNTRRGGRAAAANGRKAKAPAAKPKPKAAPKAKQPPPPPATRTRPTRGSARRKEATPADDDDGMDVDEEE